MLIACGQCARQYDVSYQAPGSTIRCECEALLIVEFHEPHSPRALRCQGCGAPLQGDRSKCPFCECEVTLDERNLGEVCPHCFARMSKNASYCMECGIAIQPQALAAVPVKNCPRCQGTLRSRIVARTAVVECVSCAGLWLTPDCFEGLCSRAEHGDRSFCGLQNAHDAQTTGMNSTVTYLPCLACDDLMIRRNYGEQSGVIIDLCGKHGVWLDHQEIEKILAFIQAGGLRRLRQREVSRLKSEARQARDLLGAGTGTSLTSTTLEVPGPTLSDALQWVASLFARWS